MVLRAQVVARNTETDEVRVLLDRGRRPTQEAECAAATPLWREAAFRQKKARESSSPWVFSVKVTSE